MPLITNNLPAGEGDQVIESEEKVQPQLQNSGTAKENHSRSGDEEYDDFEDFDDEYLDSDMEGSILNRPRPKKRVRTVPVLPKRSEKRASMIFDKLKLDLNALDGSTPSKEPEQPSVVSNPHELYLSSEDEASESADGYEDSIDSDSEDNTSSRASSRQSQEIVARVVSFTFVGKPHVISIHNEPRRSSAPSTVPPSATPRPLPFRIPNYTPNRPLSIASTNSSLTTSSSHNHNKKSKIPNLVDIVTKQETNHKSSPSKHSFLSIDPFPNAEHEHEHEHEHACTSPTSPTTNTEPPKSPTSMWKSGRPFLRRTLSAAAKRKPSMPKISLAYTPGVVQPRLHGPGSGSRSSLNLPGDVQAEASEKVEVAAHTREQQPLRYEDVVMLSSAKQQQQQSVMLSNQKGRNSSVGGGGMLGGMRFKSLRGIVGGA